MKEEMKEKQRDSEISSTKNIKEKEKHVRNLQVLDSSYDYKGNIPLRSSTGSWKASFFIIGKLHLDYNLQLLNFTIS